MVTRASFFVTSFFFRLISEFPEPSLSTCNYGFNGLCDGAGQSAPRITLGRISDLQSRATSCCGRRSRGSFHSHSEGCWSGAPSTSCWNPAGRGLHLEFPSDSRSSPSHPEPASRGRRGHGEPGFGVRQVRLPPALLRDLQRGLCPSPGRG